MGEQSVSSPNPKYIIIDEIASHCEWETFIEGVPCKNGATKVIVEVTYDNFHSAHLCEEHIDKAFNLTIEDRYNGYY